MVIFRQLASLEVVQAHCLAGSKQRENAFIGIQNNERQSHKPPARKHSFSKKVARNNTNAYEGTYVGTPRTYYVLHVQSVPGR